MANYDKRLSGSEQSERRASSQDMGPGKQSLVAAGQDGPVQPRSVVEGKQPLVPEMPMSWSADTSSTVE